jgi:hypothetical protein
MSLNLSLLSTGTRVLYRIGHYTDGKSTPTWSSWNPGSLYVNRRASELKIKKGIKAKHVRNSKAGDILALVINEAPECPEFAQDEYSTEHDMWCKEGIYLQFDLLV